MMCKCLYCYKPLRDGEVDYHRACARKIFDGPTIPVLPYTRDNISEMAREIVSSHSTVTGVQPKLSLDISEGKSDEPKRLTIVGLWGRFILKPQTDLYPHLPELEDVTMRMAEMAGICTVPHSLIRFSDGELAYITRRVDRKRNGGKIAMEDMCQLSERLTEDKYKGSYERAAKLIRQYSSVPLLDMVRFWQEVVFSWIVGNADMHLKNFSLYCPSGSYLLTDAYDLLSTALVMPEDTEELALTLNGKKRKLSRHDFEYAMSSTGLAEKVIGNIFRGFERALSGWIDLVGQSFIPEEMQHRYMELIESRIKRLNER